MTRCLKVYNVPELISGPIAISQRELLQAIRSANAAADEPQKPIPAKRDSIPEQLTRRGTCE